VGFAYTRLGAFLGLGLSSISADLFLLRTFLMKADIPLSAHNGVGSSTGTSGALDALDAVMLGTRGGAV
jgi:hypothetical protein